MKTGELMQTRLVKGKIKYSYGAYDKYNDTEQWIRITEGCPHNCPYCYEPEEIKIFDMPEIVRNDVKIMDMNLLCKPEAKTILKKLSGIKVNNKKVYYELVCGIDYRFLTKDIATLLKQNHKKIRLAWDWYYKDQMKIKDVIDLLLKVGYKPNDIMIFMICNWRIKYKENCKKLDLCKVWNVQVADCYYDNQVKHIEPIHWTSNEIKGFRKACRKHNQLVNFKIDPEVKY